MNMCRAETMQAVDNNTNQMIGTLNFVRIIFQKRSYHHYIDLNKSENETWNQRNWRSPFVSQSKLKLTSIVEDSNNSKLDLYHNFCNWDSNKYFTFWIKKRVI